MSSFRQLAVIMFTDIVGYTSIMGRDESKAFDLLRLNRDLHNKIIAKFNGKLIKELGDGIMISFHSVTDAVHAAIEIQEACHHTNLFSLRIGIHMGEVVFENEDVFGDGVNLASRIQSFAKPGSIYISEPVHSNITNKNDIQTRFVENVKLKNIANPVPVYEVVVQKTQELIPEGSLIKKSLYKSIAVLPFVNMSNDSEQEYFSDGMSEEILNSLAHIKELKVAGRTSSFQFKGKNIDLREVGRKLNVKYVLEGSVRKHSNKVRITAQLICVDDGFHLWSERYDRMLDDIFAIQDEIANSITEKLKITLLDKKESLPQKPATVNTTAHSHYLKGRHEWNKRTKDGFIKSIEHFNDAISEDSEYSLAYAGIADSYLLLCAYHIISPSEGIGKAKTAAQKALDLNPELAEAHEALGHIELLFGTNWKYAEDCYKKAIELNPSFATAHQRYALLLTNLGRCNEATDEIQTALELDPLSAIILTDVGLIQLLTGEIDAAISTCHKVLQINSGFPVALFVSGLAYELKEAYPEAIEAFKLGVKTSRNNPVGLSALGHAYAKAGQPDEAKEILSKLLNEFGDKFVSPYCMAILHAGLGNVTEALGLLNQTITSKSVWMIHLHLSSDPRLNFLRNNPEFSKLRNSLISG